MAACLPPVDSDHKIYIYTLAYNHDSNYHVFGRYISFSNVLHQHFTQKLFRCLYRLWKDLCFRIILQDYPFSFLLHLIHNYAVLYAI